MKSHQAVYPLATMCRVLGISSSGYYAWCRHPISARARRDAEILEKIRAVHEFSRGTYGVPRIHAELVAQGMHVYRPAFG